MATEFVELEITSKTSEATQNQDEFERKDWLRLLKVWRIVNLLGGRKLKQSQAADIAPVVELEPATGTQELKHFRGDSAESVPQSWTQDKVKEERVGKFVLQRSLKKVLSLGRWQRPANKKDVEMMTVSQ
eukprot:TRINITY_DN977_c0_g1_i1.p2 TRINITY_DN977_c0_g1~~TRINITY_DN977_c0_g1_i1.p2  ORF type:complete len:130 (-),score=20.97 TRINITY_DN977_c0_g1_i1:423-812(-)